VILLEKAMARILGGHVGLADGLVVGVLTGADTVTGARPAEGVAALTELN
jgi:hypothetical protein